jgi:hypothetical protein
MIPAPPKRIVIDTNVCLDLFVFRDPRWASLLAALESGAVEAITRADCRDEYLIVLHYPHLPLDDSTRPQAAARFDALIKVVAPAESARAPARLHRPRRPEIPGNRARRRRRHPDHQGQGPAQAGQAARAKACSRHDPEAWVKTKQLRARMNQPCYRNAHVHSRASRLPAVGTTVFTLMSAARQRAWRRQPRPGLPRLRLRPAPDSMPSTTPCASRPEPVSADDRRAAAARRPSPPRSRPVRPRPTTPAPRSP